MPYKLLALLALLVAVILFAGPAVPVRAAEPSVLDEAQHSTYIIRHLQPDGKTDRYQITLRPGATLFAIAVDVLPTLAPNDALQLFQDAYRKTFPNRNVNQISIGDTFSIQVPLGTFVAKSAQQQPNNVDQYDSFSGDHLTWYPLNYPIRYRLVKAGAPNKVLVAINPDVAGDPRLSPGPVELARLVWGWDVPNFQPDYLQVRTITADSDGQEHIIEVNTHMRYLDPLRNYVDKAIKVENGPGGAKIYSFNPADKSIPFLRVEDHINGQTDLESLSPGLVRVTYMRNGVIQQIRMTGFNEFLSVVGAPQNQQWAGLYKQWAPQLGKVPTSWSNAKASDLDAYPSAKQFGSYFILAPNRLVVLTYDPQPAPQQLVCLGRPLLITGGFLLGAMFWRRRHGRWLP